MNPIQLANCENILCKDWEGFNPLANPMIYGVGTPSLVGAIVRGIIIFFPAVVPTLIFAIWFLGKGVK